MVTTTTELGEIEALLEKALPDPMRFVERIAEQLLERLAANAPAEHPQPSEATVITDLQATGFRLWEDHNLVLSAALGSCECWVRVLRWTSCSGAGTPGWAEPDAELYAEYVVPAVRRTPVRQRPDQVPVEGEDT